jgi:hypothetical protein
MDAHAAMPVFSYNPDVLAPIIVSLWANPMNVLERDKDGNPTQNAINDAKTLFNTATTNLNLVRPVVITEAEHDRDYFMQDDTEIVFVLPNKSRVAGGATGAQLLASAKLLMACTPNGI